MTQETQASKSGDYLVLPHGTELPIRCIKTNAPSTTSVAVKLQGEWEVLEQPILTLILPVWLTIAVIHKCVGRRITLRVPVSQQVFRKMSLRRIIGKWMVICGVPILVIVTGIMVHMKLSGAFSANTPDASPSIAVLLVALLFGIALTSIPTGWWLWLTTSTLGLSAKRITNTHTWVSGIGKEYLVRFPEWSGENI
jgi:hypothetical protein